jgi:hypothetical protein
MTNPARHSPSRTLAPLAALLALAAGTLPAAAQNALGDGRGLEKETGNAPRPTRSFRDEVRLRNAIVTGNAPDGKSFRGDVGYRAEGEFLGELGSNDQFAFRRDSSLGNAVARGQIRGTDALRYQFQYSGGDSSSREYNPFISRDGSGSATAPRYDDSSRPRPNSFFQTPGSGTLRSTAAFQLGRALSPTPLGERYRADGSITSVTASGLRGVVYTTSTFEPDSRRANDLITRPTDPTRPADSARPGEAVRPGEAQRASTAYEDLRERLDRLPSPAPETGTDRPSNTPTNTPSNTPGDASAPNTNPSTNTDPKADAQAAADWKTRLAQIRKALREEQDAADAPDPRKSSRDQAKRSPADQARSEATRGRSTNDSSNASPEADSRARRTSSETFNAIRAAGVSVDNLVSPLNDNSDRKDPFAQHMRGGQTALAAGRYFDAEEQFAHATDLRSDDPSATIGRLHAQLGAGMYRSAALNLRQIAINHPETLGMTYKGVLLPKPERLASIKTDLSDLIQPPTPELLDFALKREAGLLLAYLGFQTGERPLIERGLRAMQSTAERLGTTDQALGDLLRGVWLGETPEAAPQPTPEPTK